MYGYRIICGARATHTHVAHENAHGLYRKLREISITLPNKQLNFDLFVVFKIQINLTLNLAFSLQAR